VQNAVEYMVRIKDFLACRGVSKAWRAAVSDAVGYLNDKCWTELDGTEATDRCGDGFGSTVIMPASAVRCCACGRG
jgi:hypothetical protein